MDTQPQDESKTNKKIVYVLCIAGCISILWIIKWCNNIWPVFESEFTRHINFSCNQISMLRPTYLKMSLKIHSVRLFLKQILRTTLKMDRI